MGRRFQIYRSNYQSYIGMLTNYYTHVNMPTERVAPLGRPAWPLRNPIPSFLTANICSKIHQLMAADKSVITKLCKIYVWEKKTSETLQQCHAGIWIKYFLLSPAVSYRMEQFYCRRAIFILLSVLLHKQQNLLHSDVMLG